MPVEIFSAEKELSRMAKVAYVFPGQGAQTVEMVRDLYDNISASREVIDAAKDIIGEDLVNLMFDDPTGELNKTKNAQPLILIASLAILVGYLDHYPTLRKILPRLVFGHSLGELIALVVAGVLSFEDGVKIAKIRGEVMTSAPPGRMAAVRNIPQDKLNYILSAFQIDIGVINSDTQIVLSGEEKAMDQALTYLTSQNIKARPLPISIASHSRVMQAVQPQFASVLDAFPFHNSRTPVISVFEAQILEEGSAIKTAFIEQMTHTLDFPLMLSTARQLGVDTFVEFGPKGLSRDGIVSGNIQALDPSLTAFNIRDLLTIKERPLSF